MLEGRAMKACPFRRRVALRTGPLATCSKKSTSCTPWSQYQAPAAATPRSRGSQAPAIKCAARRPLSSRARGLSVIVRAEQSAAAASDGDVVVMVGDIGGTNARLSLWRTPLVASAAAERIFAKIYPTTLPTFEDVVNTFINEPEIAGLKPKAAALAIAGAIDNNCCRMTNTQWFVDGPKLSKMLGFKVQLLNDFEAVGYGILALPPSDVLLLNGPPNLEEHVAEHSKAPKVVMGPGTGLGAAQLMWDSGEQAYRVWPGEGAHATFAPRGWKQRALSEYVTNKFGHCEIEQVACGSGIELIYEFLQSDEPANRPHLLAGTKTTKDNKAISAAALDGSDPLAVEAVDLFLTIVGQEAGAMALRALAKGGVYIAGGIPPKLAKGGPNNRITAGALTEGFLMRAGRRPFQEILASTPLYVVLNDQVGKIGALEYARRLCWQA